MRTTPTYIVDSDVFITAKNLYYSFDICPGFWESLLYHHRQGQVFSIDRVRNELVAGHKEDTLVHWVRDEAPSEFFLQVDGEAVMDSYSQVMAWIEQHARYFERAKAKFATGADGWLVAYAHVHDCVVVTNEQSAPNSRSEIKLPDVCEQFEVQRQDAFTMLRSLQVRFGLLSSNDADRG